MDQPNQLDMASLNESPRRANDGQRDAANTIGHSAGDVLESALVSANARRAKRREGTGFKDIPVGQKLALISLVMLVNIGILLTFVIVRDLADLNFAAKQRQGVALLESLSLLLNEVPEYTMAAVGAKNGLAGAEAEQSRLSSEIDNTMLHISASEQQHGKGLELSQEVSELQQAWTTFKEAAPVLSASEIVVRGDDLKETQLIGLITQIGSLSNLVLDTNLDSFYLMENVVFNIPGLADQLGDLQAETMSALSGGSLTLAQRLGLEGDIEVADEYISRSLRSIEEALKSNPSLATIQTEQVEAIEKTRAILDRVRAEIVLAEQLQTTPAAAFTTLLPTVQAFEKFYEQSLVSLDSLLAGRIQTLQNRLYLNIGAVIAGLLIAAALIAFITRQITRPLRELGSVSERVGQGDLSQLAQIDSRDEIGKLARTFNTSILQLREANERQEAEIARGHRLQQNIGEFLNVAMDIAQGDFTKRGQVSEDALGNVVDAINYMTEELGYLLKDVRNATQSVNQGATDMFGTADTIAQSAQIQAQEARRAREDVQGIRSTMRQVSDEMNLSAESATQALNASREGKQAVVQTLNGMQDIRREVQAVSKRVKNLGDRSLEISEIVETISRIAEQTNLLAVNAAIESSGAGEAGLRFAVVADQVRKLAEESAYAAERVSVLIRTVQDEVQEVITGVEAGTREVEEGYRVASQAGQRLEDISTIVERSAELAQRISKATQDQVARVEQVGNVVEQMAEISQASESTVSQGRVAAEKLQQLATQLSDNLARFRLA
jgi:twitching motility protein PilJ